MNALLSFLYGLLLADCTAAAGSGGPAWLGVVEALRAAEDRYRALIEHIPVVIYVSSFDERGTLSFGIDNIGNEKYHLFHPFPQRTFIMEGKLKL